MEKNISKTLKQALGNKTQRWLAGATGLRETTICRYVKGERVPNAKNLEKIANALNVSTDYLLGIGVMEHDGCKGCMYELEPAESTHCTGCTQNAIDKYKPMTNADRIRNMSDEELAIFLEAIECNSHCWCEDCQTLKGNPCNGLQKVDNSLVKERLDWLKEKVE